MKRIAITIGDPAGIGPEVVTKAVLLLALQNYFPLVIGDICVIENAIKTFNIPLKTRVIEDSNDFFLNIRNQKSKIRNWDGTLCCIDTRSLAAFVKGKPHADNGAACVGYIRKAVQLAMDKKIDAIVTAPISKEALRLGGYSWPGHTEMIAEMTKSKDYAMMLVGGNLKVILVTTHTALRNVPESITKDRVLNVIRLAKRACLMLGIEKPKIAVAGLNPHAGESGIFGMEEIKEIAPAIEKAREEGINAEGPYSPDIVFHKAYNKKTDIVVCMYHDQGLIPLKMVAFDKGVNVTVGLPIVRTSPDHGTAYDIAWKGTANPSSMVQAIKMALRLKI